MSTNIGELVDRTYREYLEPIDNVEPYSYLTGNVDDSQTTINYEEGMFTTEEEDALGAGAIIEINQELMFSKGLNAVTNEITVSRGARGTNVETHTPGNIIKIAPAFPRKNVFDAVSDQIKNLYPSLYAVETLKLTVGTGYNIIGNAATDDDTYNYLLAPIKAISQYTDFAAGAESTGLTFKPVAVEMIDLPNPHTWTDSSGTEQIKQYTTGPDVVRAIQYQGIAAGHEVFVTFKKRFVNPVSEGQSLISIGLEPEYEPIVMAGAASQLLAGKDIKMLNASYITEQLEAAAYPVGSSQSITSSLLRYQQLLIQQARSNLRSKYPEAVTLQGINYPT